MSKPLFKNEKPYNVAVPTPYGSSINVPPGKYIAGNYFNAFYARNRELRLMPPTLTVSPELIICSYEIKAPDEAKTGLVNTTPIADPVAVPVLDEEVKVPDIIAEPKKNKGGRPRKNLADSAKDMWKDVTFILPAASEVDKMSTEQLERVATKLNVSKALPRTELIETIKLKLG